ncbi:MAG: Ig domain-containing protein, partial [Eubacterium sp.]|nr:Ig domain-containing protein [Eubacterium sp.]
KALSGQSFTIAGDTLKVQINSDNSGNAWGFKVTEIKETGAPPDPEADQKAADAVANQIRNMNPDDPASVAAARQAYDALTPEQKELVDDSVLKILTDAEKAIEEAEQKAKEDHEAAEAVEEVIKNMDVSNPTSVLEAKKAYDKLTERQKKLLDPALVALLEKALKAASLIPVKTIKITGISNQIAAGKKVQLKANVTPANASKKMMTWKTSNTKVATVTQSGLVSVAKKAGGKSVTIIATATDGSSKQAIFTIKVMKGAVKKVTIKGAKKTLAVNKTMKLKATVKTTKGKANKKIAWTSSNPKYATVSGSGKVKALKAGKGKKVKITAMATDGSGKKKVVSFKIK